VRQAGCVSIEDLIK